ncbi:hypothetical protein WSK_4091 [Novosphingobium sp. Rr 2-17]|uniref:glycoside hydrolase family 76 protein n=1 Tax=Novosphingobium sp. Rr 2-17 TaxID=555793 RepID=UPI0002699F46|nr:glycoside hydrolase family 76 protein [Novosphingobium sp. Rr 2-17]EIZ77359.1 hypothetical protein WSK_4091 [Novosphingobium sp. Rr 2-17]
MKLRFVGGLAAVVLALGAAPAQAQDQAKSKRAGLAIATLEQRWGTSDGWNASEAWQRFPIADALIDYQRRTGDKRWNAKIAAAVRNRSGLYLNDDDLWAVIANVHAWQIDRDPELLAYASSTYARIVSTYWDTQCGGGIWWDPKRTYKNAITNELLIYASTQLYLATGQDAYRDWALRTWSWFARSGMIDANGLVNDGLDGACHNNGQPHFTYNQGVLLGGLSDLTTITADPQYRTAAVRTALAATRGLVTTDGILREPFDGLGADGPMFKGVFAYHLGHLIEAMPQGPERTELLGWAQRNADAVWLLSAQGKQPIDGLWSGGAGKDGYAGQLGAAAQASGIDMLLAASS